MCNCTSAFTPYFSLFFQCVVLWLCMSIWAQYALLPLHYHVITIPLTPSFITAVCTTQSTGWERSWPCTVCKMTKETYTCLQTVTKQVGADFLSRCLYPAADSHSACFKHWYVLLISHAVVAWKVMKNQPFCNITDCVLIVMMNIPHCRPSIVNNHLLLQIQLLNNYDICWYAYSKRLIYLITATGNLISSRCFYNFPLIVSVHVHLFRAYE